MWCQWLKHLSLQDTSTVGGKCSSLGEMYNQLTPQGIRVPNAFVLTTDAYREFILHNDLEAKISQILQNIDYQNIISLKRSGLKIRNLILNAEFPHDLRKNVINNYHQLSNQYNEPDGTPQENTDVAVRSSSTAEDQADCSFAGQYDTFLNVRGEFQLIESIKACYASLYNNRAISYRHDINYSSAQSSAQSLGIAVVIQKMVRSDIGKSGVMFTIDTESGFEDVIVINSSFGLCELIVQGSAIKPDEYIINKRKLDEGFNSIIDKKMGDKRKKMVYSDNPSEKTRIVPVELTLQHQFCLTDENILELGRWALIVAKHYSQFYNGQEAFDIEFAFDGLERKMYLVQVRPETVHFQNKNKHNQKFIEYSIGNDSDNQEISKEELKKHCILSGISVGNQITSGKVRIIMNLDDRGDNISFEFNDGDILVTTSTDPDWEPLMKRAGAIITDYGGRTSHASIVSRELGVTCVVGCGNATDILKSQQVVTVSCAEGDVGFVYNGDIPFTKTETDLSQLPPPPVPLMMNLASPEIAFRFANLPHQGVGLAREEFIINNFIKAHPLALLAYDRERSEDQKSYSEVNEKIATLICGYPSGRQYYIDKLSFGIARIATGVYPHPVIVRFSDFKSNEYANLLGGHAYEPNEENPMLGWRGCSRYYSEKFKEAFGLECLAIKKAREELGLDNIIVMLPFCRTLEECRNVQVVMDEYGLKRGQNGLKIYLMCEIPANVILADKFCQMVDGFSIGSNDLTQLTLGVDRDSELLSNTFNEKNEAVLIMISDAIRICKKHGVKIGICGQAPSDHPDFAQFLIEQGIDTISLTPDSIIPTIKRLSQL